MKPEEIWCFHEIGYEKSRWVIKPSDFQRFLEEHPNVQIHFDDGRLGAYEYGIDICKDFNIKPTFFIVPNWILKGLPTPERFSKVINIDQLKEINKKCEVGSHGMNHEWLTRITKNNKRIELLASKQWLETILKTKITKFSYPGGDVDEASAKIANKIYARCYTLNPRYSLKSHLGIQRKLHKTEV